MIPLLANAGTPLMFLSVFHLGVGNALIALGEAWILRLLWQVPVAKAFKWMLIANYTTMTIGLVALTGFGRMWAEDSAVPQDVRSILVGAGVTLFVFTVLGEWAFVARALDGRFRLTPKALGVSLVLQVASYAVLVPIYMSGSTVSAITRTTPVAAVEIAGDLSASIYYVAGDGTVRCVAVDGTGDRKVGEGADPSDAWIVAEPDRGVVRMYSEMSAATRWSVEVEGRIARHHNDRGFGPAANLTDLDPRLVRAGFWPVEGLQVRADEVGDQLRLGLETPFVAWPTRHATLLPGGLVVYALGPHIVLLDLGTRRMAHLARGRCPVVVLEDSL